MHLGRLSSHTTWWGLSVLVDAASNDLTGEVDVQGNTWGPAAWWQATSTVSAWSGGQ